MPVSGDIGLPTKRLEFRGEILVLTPLTSNPATTEEGDVWLRSDVAPTTRQIGTLFMDNGGTSPDQAPVYDQSTTPDDPDVELVFGVYDGGTLGYVPIKPQAEAAFPQRGVRHAGANYGLHNSIALVIDDFEDNNITEYGGDTGLFSVQTGTVKHGTYALEFSSGSAGSGAITSTSGLNVYVSQGDTARVWLRAAQTAGNSGFVFGVPSVSGDSGLTGYYAQLDFSSQLLQLFRVDSGSFTKLASTGVTLNSGTWYRGELDWTASGGITWTVYDASGSQLATISATDTTYTSTGVGFRGANSATASTFYYDYARII